MIGVSVFALLLVVLALIWGIKNKQFDDETKWLRLDDSEESLKEAQELDIRRREAKKNKENT